MPSAAEVGSTPASALTLAAFASSWIACLVANRDEALGRILELEYGTIIFVAMTLKRNTGSI